MFLKADWQEPGKELSTKARIGLAIVIAGLAAALMIAIISQTKAGPELAALVASNLELSGVENPVTAVLLNFRSYDTLLEIAVLMIVALAMMPLKPSHPELGAFIVELPRAPLSNILAGLLKWLVPLAVIIGAYLLWTGASAPGGAFQAGAVIAAAGVVLALAGQHRFIWHSLSARILLLAGLLMFVVVGAANSLFTGTTLQYPQDYSGLLILLIEIAATLSIAAILLMLFTRLKSLADDTVSGGPS